MFDRVAVLGAGSWGMAVAGMLHHNGLSVKLWEYDRAEYALLVQHRGQPEKLKDFRLPDGIFLSNDLIETVADCTLVILAVPSQVLRPVVRRLNGAIPPETGIVNLAKGIETGSLKRMSEVIAEELYPPPENVATLSGPSHAEEVAADLPTTVVLAGRSSVFIEQLQPILSNRFFRVYLSSDLVGVELAGSLKNIIAIAAGIADGLGMGDNTRGALITRGLAEITRLGLAMGARAETFAGLSGIGDLVTTCCSQHSRNRYVGEQIGMGRKLSEVLEKMTMVAEGVQTTRSGFELAARYEVETPIIKQVHAVLFEDKAPREAVEELMVRSLKPEVWH